MIIPDCWMFVVASLALNLTPGNDMLYVITRSSMQGAKAGVISSLGIMLGCAVHIVTAVIGLSALIAKSAVAFQLIKYIGAAYLIYLGFRALMSRASSFHPAPDLPAHSLKRLFWQGVLTNVLNPKVALFFLAFLPQFIPAGTAHPGAVILLLGAWFNVSGTIVNILVALLFGRVGAWLQRSSVFVKWQQKLTGAILLALGIRVAVGSR